MFRFESKLLNYKLTITAHKKIEGEKKKQAEDSYLITN